jgi:hypothetical protein
MKVREVADGEEILYDADFTIVSVGCGETIGYRTPGDDPGYPFCPNCHDGTDVFDLGE